MVEIKTLKCVVCGQTYEPFSVEYTCPSCGEAGTLDVLYDYAQLAQDVNREQIATSNTFTSWRYKPLLPVPADAELPPLAVGWTPLYHTPRLAQAIGVEQAWVKDDGANPTGSLKDRASTHVVAMAMSRGMNVVSTASTGNAAAALAGIAASVPGMQSIIFVPATAPEAKIAQLLVYGAQVLLIEDTYDVAFDFCMQTCIEKNWYCRNTGVNPFTTEGKKTVSLEIAEQLGWQAPDVVVVSVGDGSIISGVYKGFYDLHQLGWIDKMPRIIGVQAEGSRPLVDAWLNDTAGEAMQPVNAHTIADSISAGLPRDRVKALRAVRATDGAYIAVSDDEILRAIPEFARLTGVFAEPASVASFVGARHAVESGYIKSNERLVIISTGNGLKDVKRAQQSVQGGIRVQPNQDALQRALSKIEMA
jgi:threonine synthase